MKLISGLSSPLASIRARSASSLGTAIQNNPKVQSQFLELHGLKALVEALKAESELKDSREKMNVIGKIVYAIMATLGHNTHAQKEFREAGGFKQLYEILSKPPHPHEDEVPVTSNDDNTTIEETKTTDSDIPEVVEIEDKVKREAERRQKRKNVITENTYPTHQRDYNIVTSDTMKFHCRSMFLL
jgi:hypothetical protein